MHLSKSLASAMLLALPAYAAFPVASVEFQSWESCPVGIPAQGEPKFKATVAATPATCDKTPVNPDWSIDNYSFKAELETKEALLCSGIAIWNNEDCSGRPVSFLPFDGEPVVQGQCLSDILEPGYVSFQLECPGYEGGQEGPEGPGGY